MKIPFGKDKGEYVNYLPDDYLRWLYFQAYLFAGIHAKKIYYQTPKQKRRDL